MKRIFNNNISNLFATVLMSLLVGSAVTACVPGADGADDGGIKPGTTPVETKPDPEGTRAMVLYSDTGDNIAGLGFSEAGFITSLSYSADWYLVSVGVVPGLGNVDYIPMDGWGRDIYPELGLGFVGYSPTQGFVRFLVAGIVIDEYTRKPAGVGLKYCGSFNGSDKAVELDKNEYRFPAKGGKVTAKVQGKEYVPFQFGITAPWADVKLASSVYSFINDLVEITVETNPTAEERTADLVLSNREGTVTHISIIQAADPSASVPDSDSEE